MAAPTTLFRPFDRLVKITVLGREFEVPENNSLLRCLQYLAPEEVSYGRFCWNEDCQYCRVTYDLGEGTPARAALSCKLTVQDGMRVREAATEIRYCLRKLNSGKEPPVLGPESY
jgi:predicted molibdopterin-dependent oxidoreductase YjgC